MATNPNPPKGTVYDQMSGVVLPFPDRLSEVEAEQGQNLFDEQPKLSLVESGDQTRPNPNRLKYTIRRLVALGGVAVTGIIAATTFNGESEPKPFTDHVSHVVKAGDTLTGIAAGELATHQDPSDPRGSLPGADQAATYLHTEFNPGAGTVQDPKDDVLQIGERVVGEIPFTPPTK